MKRIEQIIILEENDISMFIARGMLAPLEESYFINYFTKVEETMKYLETLTHSSSGPVSLFVDISTAMDNEEFIRIARETILSAPFRLFLLSPMIIAGEKKKLFQELGFLCCIEEPLTEQKVMDALSTDTFSNN